MLTCSERAGSFNPASGGYTPANRGPASGDYTLAVTYRGDVYFVPVLVSIFRDCTCWHALSLIRGTPYLLTEFIS
ncbi:hypothetical protein SLEP1_g22382 [Rubroshorea leprosula]|uniref:Uncharacterized protein n=1 Tax=Rubroshorea leprosula TaxID=152421 RepID=A0AAV5JF32_9ROSI|nr:hypothetical protein SLEP1_g22382 [Rubroshorea leprosula]